MKVIHRTDRNSRIDSVIDAVIAQQRLVGAVVLIAERGRVVYRRCAGYADRERGLSMHKDTLFRYASLTKPIVSASAMVLIERGQLRLDDPVTRWLPDFRPRLGDGSEAAITVHQLLTHTAGLSYGFFEPPDGPYHLAGVSDGLDLSGIDLEEEMRRLASVPLLYPPGTSWGYSLAIDVLGAVLTRVTARSLPVLVRELVTGPLGMSNCDFSVGTTERLAVPYADASRPMVDNEVVNMAASPSGIRFAPSRILDSSSFASGGAGMAGSGLDFLRFLEALRVGGAPILKRETVEAMMSNQIGSLRITLEPTPASGFGYGGAVLMDPALAELPQGAGTWKWGGVYGHHWYVDPVHERTVVAMTNTAIEGMFGAFGAELMQAAYS